MIKKTKIHEIVQDSYQQIPMHSITVEEIVTLPQLKAEYCRMIYECLLKKTESPSYNLCNVKLITNYLLFECKMFHIQKKAEKKPNLGPNITRSYNELFTMSDRH